MKRPDLRSLPGFRGPRKTLILFDPWLEMWIVIGWNGGEVIMPEDDLVAFIQHCVEHLRLDEHG